jgi:hypothetical protein
MTMRDELLSQHRVPGQGAVLLMLVYCALNCDTAVEIDVEDLGGVARAGSHAWNAAATVTGAASRTASCRPK